MLRQTAHSHIDETTAVTREKGWSKASDLGKSTPREKKILMTLFQTYNSKIFYKKSILPRTRHHVSYRKRYEDGKTGFPPHKGLACYYSLCSRKDQAASAE